MKSFNFGNIDEHVIWYVKESFCFGVMLLDTFSNALVLVPTHIWVTQENFYIFRNPARTLDWLTYGWWTVWGSDPKNLSSIRIHDPHQWSSSVNLILNPDTWSQSLILIAEGIRWPLVWYQMILKGVRWSWEVSYGLERCHMVFRGVRWSQEGVRLFWKDCTVSGICQIVQIFFHLQSIFHLYRLHQHTMQRRPFYVGWNWS